MANTPAGGQGPLVCKPGVIRALTNAVGREIPVQVVQVEERELAVEIGKAPFARGASWTEALPSWLPQEAPSWVKGLAEDLQLALTTPKGMLLTPDEVWLNPQDRAVVLKALSSPSHWEARTILADWLIHDKGLPWPGVSVRFPTLGPVVAFTLSEENPFRRVGKTGLTALTSKYISEHDRQVLLRAMNDPEKWPKLAPMLLEMRTRVRLAEEMIKNFLSMIRPYAEKVLGPEEAARAGVIDIYERVLNSPLLDKAERAELRRLVEDHRMIPTDDKGQLALEWFLKAAEADAKARRDALAGVIPRLERKLGPLVGLRRFTRGAALATGRFLAENIVSDTIFKPLLTGFARTPFIAWNEFRAYWAPWFSYLKYGWTPELLRQSGTIPKSEAQVMLERIGVNRIPIEVSASFERAMTVQELEARLPSESSIWDVPLLGRFRDIPRPLQRVSPLHWFASWESVVMRLARVQESATRFAVYAERLLTLFERDGLPAIEGYLRDLFELHRLDPEAASSLMREFRGRISRTPDDLADMVRERFPGYETLALQARRVHQAVLDDLSDSAIQTTRQVNYDYLSRRNADEILTQVFKFHFWATRNLPFYLEEFAKHHALFRAFVRWKLAQERQAKEEGWPQRVGQMLPLLETSLFGQDVTLYVALWQLISVTGQVDPPSVTAYGTVPERASWLAASTGMSLHWDIQFMLGMLGYQTSDLPPIFPLSRSLMRSLGVRVNPLAPALEWARERTSGRLPGSVRVQSETLTGSHSFDRAVWRELLFLSYERTGKPNHPRYVAALANPEDPLFQEAMRRVASRQGIAEVAYLLSPIPFRAESATELELRRRMAAQGEVSPGEYLAQVKEGAPERWTTYIPEDVRDAQIQSGFALDRVLRAQGRHLDPAWVQEHLPWFFAYQEWSARQPEGQRSVRRFLREVPELPAP